MLIILLTIFCTLLVLGVITHQLYLKYKHSSINLWLLSPLFLFNGIVVLTFFIPYLFHLSFGTVKPGLDLTTPQNVKDLGILCVSLMLSNLFVYLLDFFGVKRKIKRINILAQKKEILLFLTLFSMVLILNFSSILVGQYYIKSLGRGKGASLSPGVTGFYNFFSGLIKRFAWIGLIVLYFNKFSNNKRYKTLLWGLLLGNVIFTLPSGSKSLVLIPLLLFAFCYLIFTNKNFLKFVIIGTVSLALFVSLYNIWRVWASQQKRGLTLSYVEFLSRHPIVKKRGRLFFVVNSFVQRLDTFSNYFILTDFYPDKSEFLKGKSYLPTLVSPIPRIIFPSKPVSVDRNEIGRKTGILAPTDYTTTPGIAWWGEAYINFGYFGMFFLLLMVLTLYQFLFLFWLRNRSNLIVTASYFTFLLYIPLTIHGGIGGILGDLSKFLVFLTPLFLIIYLPSKNENRN